MSEAIINPIEYFESRTDVLYRLTPCHSHQANIFRGIIEALPDILISLGVERLDFENRNIVFLVPIGNDALAIRQEARQNALKALQPFGITDSSFSVNQVVGKTYGTVGLNLGIFLTFYQGLPLLQVTITDQQLIDALSLSLVDEDREKTSQNLSKIKPKRSNFAKIISSYSKSSQDALRLEQSLIKDNPSQRNLTLFTIKKELEEYKKLLQEDKEFTTRQQQLELTALQKTLSTFLSSSDIIDSTVRAYRVLFILERVILTLEKQIADQRKQKTIVDQPLKSLMLEHDTLAISYIDSCRFVVSTLEILVMIMQMNRSLERAFPFVSFTDEGDLAGVASCLFETDEQGEFLSPPELKKALKKKDINFIPLNNKKIGPYSDKVLLSFFSESQTSVSNYKDTLNNRMVSTLYFVTPAGLKNLEISAQFFDVLAGLPRHILTEQITSDSDDDSTTAFVNDFVLDIVEQHILGEMEELESEPWYRNLAGYILEKVLGWLSFIPKAAITVDSIYLYNTAISFPESVISYLLNHTNNTEYALLREINNTALQDENIGSLIPLDDLNNIAEDVLSKDKLKAVFSADSELSESSLPLLGIGLGAVSLGLFLWLRHRKE